MSKLAFQRHEAVPATDIIASAAGSLGLRPRWEITAVIEVTAPSLLIGRNRGQNENEGATSPPHLFHRAKRERSACRVIVSA
jgi:hypothetical protein